jgi:hypothetical protein
MGANGLETWVGDQLHDLLGASPFVKLELKVRLAFTFMCPQPCHAALVLHLMGIHRFHVNGRRHASKGP